MRITLHRLACLVVCLTLNARAFAADSGGPFDDGWKFTRGDPAAAEAPTFDDAQWQSVDLPHDWSIAGPISPDNPAGHAGGFFPTGVGWYRKTFTAPAEWAGRHVAIQFDGSYMLTDVWINGHKLGRHVSGYSPFDFDLTPHLSIGGSNTIAVRVDNSHQPSARWYTGSGLYRHVRLAVRGAVHVARFGTFITTPNVTDSAATLDLAVTVENDGDDDPHVTCATEVFAADANGKPTGPILASFAPATLADQPATQEVRPPHTARFVSRATLPTPKLWTPDTPTLYLAITTVSANGDAVDRRETPFGVRTIDVSADKGFLLNGKPVELFGACVHDDNGALGTAAFDRAEVRRVEELKAAGFNAVRCAHNPPAPAFLDACDRLGLLVVDEAFDTWSAPKVSEDFSHYFHDGWRDELDAMILRDRNHPSIVIWSLGNEVWLWGRQAAQSAIEGAALIARAKQLDPTRFDTTATAGWNLPDKPWAEMAPLLNRFDVVGYNYALHRYTTDHAAFPNRIIVGTESFPRDMFAAFDLSDRYAHVLGDFVWTGIDYLGESGIGRYVPQDQPAYFHEDPRQFPYHGGYCGDIDLTGFRKPVSYARNITWGRGERLYTSVAEMTPDGRKMKLTAWAADPSRASWTWPGFEGKPLEVQVYSRYNSVRLYLNDQLIGEKPTGRDQQFKATFDVPYAAGTLSTAGVEAGQEVERIELHTAGPVVGLRLTADRTQIAADGQDLAYVTVESIDKEGRVQPTGDQVLQFAVDGGGKIAAVTSGDLGRLPDYQGSKQQLFHGRAQVVIRSARDAGTATVRATADGLTGAEVQIAIRKPDR